MKTLLVLCVCSIYFVKAEQPVQPPQHSLVILYTGVATALPHQSFFSVDKIRYETKRAVLRKYIWSEAALKKFKKSEIEMSWTAQFHSFVINQKTLSKMESFIEKNPKYFTALKGEKNTEYLFDVKGKIYKVSIANSKTIFIDLLAYLKTNNCDSAAINEVNWYVTQGN